MDVFSDTFLSERFLIKCLERKDVFGKDWVKSYRNEDPDASPPGLGWGVFGKKKVILHIDQIIQK